MDDDIQEMLDSSPRGGSQGCATCRLVEQMTPEHRASLDKAFDTVGINTTGILAWMKKHGYVYDIQAPRKSLLEHKARHRG